MSKKSVSWLELIKLKLGEEKSKGNSPSINDIMPEAKKEWAQIKAGTHPKYIQGKSQTFARKKKADGSNKTTRKADKKSAKNSSGSASSDNSTIQEIMEQVKMCGKCKKKVEKVLAKKNMTGGYNQFYDVPAIGNGDGTLIGPASGSDVTGFDATQPTYTLIGGKGKKSKGKKQKGGCGPAGCLGGGGK
jgi:hypothetical protein